MTAFVPFVSVTGKVTNEFCQFTQFVWNAKIQRGFAYHATLARTECGRTFCTFAEYAKVEGSAPAPRAVKSALASPVAVPVLLISVRDFHATPTCSFFVGSARTPMLVFQPVPFVWRSSSVLVPINTGWLWKI